MCKDCLDSSCKSCERVVIYRQGERGLPGPPGVQGPKGNDGTNGRDGDSYVLKTNYYNQVILDVDVKDQATPNVYSFPDAAYNVLSFTNNSGSTKSYFVNVSYDVLISGSNAYDLEHWVDGAIIKTVSGVDSVEYESLGTFDALGSLYSDTTLGSAVNRSTTEKVQSTTPNDVEFRFGSYLHPRNISFFKKVTLNNGESVSLKFKTKDVTSESRLRKGQIFVNELDQ